MKKGLLFFFFFLGIQSSYACNCPEIPLKTSIDSSTIILEGQVVEISTNWVSGGLKVTVQVKNSWRQKSEPFFTFNTPFESNCGIPFQKKKDYLIFLKRKFYFKTNACDPVFEGIEIEEIRDQLGEPMKANWTRRYYGHMFFMTLLAVGGLVFLGIIVFVSLRKHKNTTP